jgi:hypothetical protein
MKRIIGFCLLFGLLSTPIFSQTPPSREISYHIGYLSNNAVRPGVNFGLEYGLMDVVKLKSKVKEGRGAINTIKVHQIIAAANLGVLWHPQSSTSLLNTYTLEYRKTTKRRMQYQIGLGGAYMRNFFPNSYIVNSSGEVSSRTFGGAGYGGLTQFIGYGRYRKDNRAMQWWHMRIGATYLLGYNSFLLPYLTAELRLGFHKKPVG